MKAHALIFLWFLSCMNFAMAQTSATLWYRVRGDETIHDIVKNIGYCDGTPTDCDSWIKKIQNLNPQKLLEDKIHFKKHARLTLPGYKLPDNSTYLLIQNNEVVPELEKIQGRKEIEVIDMSMPNVAPRFQLTPAEIAKKEAARDHREETKSWIKLTPYFSATELNSTDLVSGFKDELGSKIDTGFNEVFVKKLGTDFSANIHAKTGYVLFALPEGGPESISEKYIFRSEIGIGGTAYFLSRLAFGVSLGENQELFVRGVSSTSVAIDSVFVPTLGAKLTLDAIKSDTFVLSVTGTYDLKMGATTANYKVNSGNEIGGLIEAGKRYRLDDVYRIGAAATLRNQNTSITSQTDTVLSVFLSFYFTQPKL